MKSYWKDFFVFPSRNFHFLVKSGLKLKFLTESQWKAERKLRRKSICSKSFLRSQLVNIEREEFLFRWKVKNLKLTKVIWTFFVWKLHQNFSCQILAVEICFSWSQFGILFVNLWLESFRNVFMKTLPKGNWILIESECMRNVFQRQNAWQRM